MSVRKTLARNTGFNAAGRLWEAVSLLVLTPYIIHKVGLSAYGVWALAGVSTSYIGLFDLGISSSYVKYIAEHAARKEDDDIAAVVSTGLFFYLILGVILVVAGWPCVDLIIDLVTRLKGPNAIDSMFLDDARFIFRWALVLFAASNCVGAFTAIQTGLQRMGFTNLLSFVCSILKFGAILLFLAMGTGIRGLLYAEAAALFVFGSASIALAFHLLPSLRVGSRFIRGRTFRKLLGFGLRAQVAKFSNLILFQTDMVVAGVLFGQFGIVGLYKVGVELATKVRQLPLLLLTAVLPAASDLDARKDHEGLRKLYLRATKYTAAVGVPMIAFTLAMGGGLMRTWMGPGYETAAWILRIIAFGYIANIMPGAGVSIALGKGRVDLQMNAGIISTVANIGLTIGFVALLALVWGLPVAFWGIPVGTALSLFISWFWFTAATKDLLRVAPRELMRVSLVWPTLASLPGFVLCAVADWWTSGLAGRVPNAGVLLACAAAFSVSYLVLIRLTPFLDAFDVDFLEDTLKLKHIPGVSLWTRGFRHG